MAATGTGSVTATAAAVVRALGALGTVAGDGTAAGTGTACGVQNMTESETGVTVLAAGNTTGTVPATGDRRETAFEHAGMLRPEHVVLATVQQPDQATALVPVWC